MSELADQIEFLLMDVDGVAAPPRVPQRLRSYAVAHTFRSLRILSKQGWGPAHRYLQDLRPGPGWREYCELEPARAIRLARREMPFSQFVLRLLRPNALCLPRSLSLGTYLAAIGLPAEVIVARERSCTNPRYRFHSWTELYGDVLNDNPDVQLGFTVLQRVSAEGRRTMTQEQNG